MKLDQSEANPKEESVSEFSAIVKSALLFVENNLNQKFTLSEMSDRLSVCRSTMVQCFRRETGISLYAYVIKRRLEQARALMIQGVSPIIAAQECGFGDYSSFYRSFHKEYGMSPNQWKDQQSDKP